MDEKRLLMALQRYYINDISFEKVADIAEITVYELIEYVKEHELPIIHTEKDVTEGIRKMNLLLEKYGLKPIVL